jgi:MoxR-like ATPase
MLEAMQERRVTAIGKPFVLDAPFLVLATQNPVEQEGTYPLPEAQLDRFLMKILVGYPSQAELSQIVELTTERDAVVVSQVLDRDQIAELRATCRQVIVAPHVRDYAVRLVMATQPGTPFAPAATNRYVRYGSSPRGAQGLIECGRVLALLSGRMHLSVGDLRAMAPSVLRHRIILNFEGHSEGQTQDTLLAALLDELPHKV